MFEKARGMQGRGDESGKSGEERIGGSTRLNNLSQSHTTGGTLPERVRLWHTTQ